MSSSRPRAAPNARPVDLLLKGGKVLDVFSGRFLTTDLAVDGGRIVGFGAEHAGRTVELDGAYVVPGFVDSHVHLESSQVTPAEFACAVLPRGTTTVVADPHEIANVLGVEGVRYMLQASKGLPLRVYLTAPSCVPASPLSTAGAELNAQTIAELLTWPRVVGLGEMMNYPGVLAGDEQVLAKLAAARGLPIDGHAPGLHGPPLWAYALAGPRTDHECTELAEAQEKLRSGMHILIREGTTARNLEALLPLLTWHTAPFVHFCTDDRHPPTLAGEGHLDQVIREAISAGILPELVFTAATLHAARCYGLLDVGALAPGYRADLVVLSDLVGVNPEQVYAGGSLVAEGGKCILDLSSPPPPPGSGTLVDANELSFSLPAGSGPARVIDVVAGQVLTGESWDSPTTAQGQVLADPERDLLKLAVVERHRGTGRVGLALVRGFGLRRGALASTVAHDAHNLVVVGVDDEDMRSAATTLVEHGGGQVVMEGGQPRALLPLPIAGLMSDRPLEEVAQAARGLKRAAAELGCSLPDPFMSLSFLALEVIPHLKLTDLGLVDVDQFCIVPLFAEQQVRE
ncbi:MAG: adenine deaminase [Candidatus Bipolaricaulota bacterium]